MKIVLESDSNSTLGQLKLRLDRVKKELAEKGMEESIPELITKANVIRQNEFLIKTDATKTELLSVYEQYVAQLESTLKNIFDIQNELKNLLKDHAKHIAGHKKKPKRKTTKLSKSKKK